MACLFLLHYMETRKEQPMEKAQAVMDSLYKFHWALFLFYSLQGNTNPPDGEANEIVMEVFKKRLDMALSAMVYLIRWC